MLQNCDLGCAQRILDLFKRSRYQQFGAASGLEGTHFTPGTVQVYSKAPM